ncbi:SHUGOSHIN 2-like [Andrographis paniculata]|uniref:SHUGOSHIN 2-like n=1 Tax=Andrographis paniculata TaxID=175694 RepID=UPI0021E7FB96|nr:SHUGOSHIN 2-like [Andrographis paniculata]
MSKTGGFLILDSNETTAAAAIIGEEAEIAAKPCPQNLVPKKLVDISNLPPKHTGLVQEGKPQPVPVTIKDYIEQLQKDNMALSNVLAQKNKIIAERGNELEKLRANMIKVQEQNRKLALSHTQMLADVNTGKDQLKALRHELGCKTGLLKANNTDFVENNTGEGQCQNANVEMKSIKLQKEQLSENSDEDEPRKNAKRRLRSHSLGASESAQPQVNAGNKKRPLTRRQSARFKADESKHATDLSDSDSPKAVPENRPPSNSADVDDDGRRESLEVGRSSLCRPLRQAAKKVHSYKEIPLNVKMRRS